MDDIAITLALAKPADVTGWPTDYPADNHVPSFRGNDSPSSAAPPQPLPFLLQRPTPLSPAVTRNRMSPSANDAALL
ncbi:MAG: hypothetical protein RMJ82_15695, partial [Gemmatales bacterium]|nr:hypothetical protein [Gemmatales bacterium]